MGTRTATQHVHLWLAPSVDGATIRMVVRNQHQLVIPWNADAVLACRTSNDRRSRSWKGHSGSDKVGEMLLQKRSRDAARHVAAQRHRNRACRFHMTSQEPGGRSAVRQ